jgi:hypothetical protein
MRPLIVAVLLIAAGVQTIFASFVLSMLGIRDNVVVRPSVVLEPELEMRDVTGVGRRRPTNGSSNGTSNGSSNGSHHQPLRRRTGC